MTKIISPGIIIFLLCISMISFGQIQFKAPDEGWLYIYEANFNNHSLGNSTSNVNTSLDGTWEEGGDWDLSGIADSGGLPGGADLFENDGVSFLRIQDPGSPGDFSSLGNPRDPGNNKISFSHALTQDGVLVDDQILDNGITLAFRIKVPLDDGSGKLDSIYPSSFYWPFDVYDTIWPYPVEGNGYLPSLGHGMVSIHQHEMGPDDPRSIGFSLMTEYDHDTIAYTGEGLYMNSNFGNVPISRPNPFWDNDPHVELAVNHIDCNPREWNEFWVQIIKDSTSAATHSVKIWMNGDIDSPDEFLVTASVRSWTDSPHMYMGFINNRYSGAVDIDYYGVQKGLIDPVSPCEGMCFNDAVCLGDTLSVVYSYDISTNSILIWDFGEATYIDTGDVKKAFVSWEEPGYKTISLLVSENGIITASYLDSVFVNSSIPSATFLADNQDSCGIDPFIISYTGNASQEAGYNWDFDNGDIISGTESGPYEITWSDAGIKTVSLTVSEKGCCSDTSISLEVRQQPMPIEICMVSVDSSNYNMVVWEQAVNNTYDLVKIYKQTSKADVYEEIATQSSDNISVFIDSLSSPAQSSDMYKIAVIDSVGCESPLSEYHKTLHLTISTAIGGAWNLIWEEYEGFEYSTYNIYRGTSSDDLLKIAERASNTFTFTDLYPPVGTVYYMLDIELQDPCSISYNKSSNNSFNSTQSNICSTAGIASTQNLSQHRYVIYPNPFNNYTTIQFHNPDGEKYQLSIVDLSGKIVYFQADILTEKIEISRNGLSSGIYLFELMGSEIYRGKIIVE